MTDDFAEDTNKPNVLKEHKNSVLRSPGRKGRRDSSFQTKWCEDDANAENDCSRSILLHWSLKNVLWRSLAGWYKQMFCLKHKTVVSCCNRRRVELLFCMQGTGYSKSFSPICKKIVVRNSVVLSKAPERLQGHLQEKQVYKKG